MSTIFAITRRNIMLCIYCLSFIPPSSTFKNSTFKNSTFCPHKVCNCFVRTAAVSIKLLNFISQTQYVYSEKRTESICMCIYIYIYVCVCVCVCVVCVVCVWCVFRLILHFKESSSIQFIDLILVMNPKRGRDTKKEWLTASRNVTLTLTFTLVSKRLASLVSLWYQRR